MKIVYMAGREPAYVRNAMLLQGLTKNGLEIIDCTDSSASYPARYCRVLFKFLTRSKKNASFVFIGFLGQPLVPVVGKLTNKPIILDAFLSVYDTMCFDRKKFRPDSLAGRFFFWLDKHSCSRADTIILDTNAHIDYFVRTFGARKDKFRRVLVGADESVFYPREEVREEGRFRIYYYASYLPLHGTEYIVRAAAMVKRNREIEFRIVGNGPERAKIRRLVQELGVSNISFADWVPYQDLPAEIAQADLCLGGHFSDIEKAKRVIAGKTYQFIAMKKPVILGDCPGNRELFSHKENAFLVPMADARSLADAILELKQNEPLRKQLTEAGYALFREKCTVEAIGAELAKVLGSADGHLHERSESRSS